MLVEINCTFLQLTYKNSIFFFGGRIEGGTVYSDEISEFKHDDPTVTTWTEIMNTPRAWTDAALFKPSDLGC